MLYLPTDLSANPRAHSQYGTALSHGKPSEFITEKLPQHPLTQKALIKNVAQKRLWASFQCSSSVSGEGDWAVARLPSGVGCAVSILGAVQKPSGHAPGQPAWAEGLEQAGSRGAFQPQPWVTLGALGLKESQMLDIPHQLTVTDIWPQCLHAQAFQMTSTVLIPWANSCVFQRGFQSLGWC